MKAPTIVGTRRSTPLANTAAAAAAAANYTRMIWDVALAPRAETALDNPEAGQP